MVGQRIQHIRGHPWASSECQDVSNQGYDSPSLNIPQPSKVTFVVRNAWVRCSLGEVEKILQKPIFNSTCLNCLYCKSRRWGERENLGKSRSTWLRHVGDFAASSPAGTRWQLTSIYQTSNILWSFSNYYSHNLVQNTTDLPQWQCSTKKERSKKQA